MVAGKLKALPQKIALLNRLQKQGPLEDDQNLEVVNVVTPATILLLKAVTEGAFNCIWSSPFHYHFHLSVFCFYFVLGQLIFESK